MTFTRKLLAKFCLDAALLLLGAAFASQFFEKFPVWVRLDLMALVPFFILIGVRVSLGVKGGNTDGD
jgi:hypothetical protein